MKHETFGRKYTFLVTMLIMDGATFVIGILLSYDAIEIGAPTVVAVALTIATPFLKSSQYANKRKLFCLTDKIICLKKLRRSPSRAALHAHHSTALA
jgi:hypothetical protein